MDGVKIVKNKFVGAIVRASLVLLWFRGWIMSKWLQLGGGTRLYLIGMGMYTLGDMAKTVS